MTQNRKPAKQSRHVDEGAKRLAIFRASLRKWALSSAILGLVLAVAAAVVVWEFWQPKYEARQFVRVIQDVEFLQLFPEDRKDKIDPKSQLAPIKSELLLRQILLDPAVSNTTSPGSYEKKIKELQSKISYAPAGGELYSIACSDDDPRDAALIAQKITEAYIDTFFVHYRADRIKELTESLEKEINSTSEKVKSLDRRLSALKKESSFVVSEVGSMPMDVDGNLLVNLRNDLKEAKLVEQNLQIEQELLAEQLTASELKMDPADIQLLVDNDNEVIRARDYLYHLQTERTRNQDRAKPIREKTELSIQRYTRQLAETIERVKKKVRFELLRKSKSTATARLADVDLQIKRNQLRIDSDEADIKTLTDNRSGMLELQSRFNDLKSEKIKAEFSLAKWTDARDKIRSREISPIRVAIAGSKEVLIPTEPIEKYPIKLLLLSTLGAFFAPFLMAFLLELKANRITEPTQLLTQTNAELIGELSELPRTVQRKTISKRLMRQVQLYEESVDSVSAAIRLGEERKAHIIGICSAASSEGKTTLASQFAMSAARSGTHKTLLIDGDLRRPNIHRVFDADLDCGLVDVLDGGVSFEDAIISSGAENLDILVAGKLNLNPMRYFVSESWHDLLIKAMSEYSLIVVDTAPILAASESLAIAKSCDIAILCVLRDVSRHDSFRLALGRLLAADVDVAGFVFGGVPQQDYANKYGKYQYELA